MGRPSSRSETCPPWCVQPHDLLDDEDLHIGGALLVRRTLLRLCSSIDRDSGTLSGPFVLVDDAGFTLHEADVLAAALTQLVDQGRASAEAPPPPHGDLSVID